MTQEEKELLLKDLCSRLPYGVKISVLSWDEREMEYIDRVDVLYSVNGDDYIKTVSEDYNFSPEDVKPYLFPLSSMTEEQKYDFYCRFIENDCDFDDFKKFYLDYGMWHKLITSLDNIEEVIDWFRKNHFDYRGLIHKDLAIDATNLNIY